MSGTEEIVWREGVRVGAFFSYHHFHANVSIDAVHKDIAKKGMS